MRSLKPILCAGVAATLLAGCVTQPAGPTIPVRPAAGKSFDAFRSDKAECEDYAADETRGEARTANNRAVGAALIGAGLGAAFGGAVAPHNGAATGAAVGGTFGTAIGAGESSRAQYSIQERYDLAYAECMSAKGNDVPAFDGPADRYDDEYGPPPPRRYRRY